MASSSSNSSSSCSDSSSHASEEEEELKFEMIGTGKKLKLCHEAAVAESIRKDYLKYNRPIFQAAHMLTPSLHGSVKSLQQSDYQELRRNTIYMLGTLARRFDCKQGAGQALDSPREVPRAMLELLESQLDKVKGSLGIGLKLREQDPGRRLSAVDTDLELHFAISLFPNYQEELDQLTNDLYDISSPLYGQFITSEEYVARFSPTVEQVETVSTYLSQNGLTVTEVNKNRMLIHAKGNVGAINSAFQIQLGHYSMGSDEEAYFQPDQKPTIPQGLSIIGIHGLSNKNKRHHNWKRGPKVTKEQMEAQVEKERQQPKEESNVLRRKLQQNGQLPFTPQGISKAYKLSSTYLGEAQAAAVVEFDTYLANDISAYTEFFGIRSVPLENILITVGADTPPLVPGDGQIEVTLDIQLATQCDCSKSYQNFCVHCQ